MSPPAHDQEIIGSPLSHRRIAPANPNAPLTTAHVSRCLLRRCSVRLLRLICSINSSNDVEASFNFASCVVKRLETFVNSCPCFSLIALSAFNSFVRSSLIIFNSVNAVPCVAVKLLACCNAFSELLIELSAFIKRPSSSFQLLTGTLIVGSCVDVSSDEAACETDEKNAKHTTNNALKSKRRYNFRLDSFIHGNSFLNITTPLCAPPSSGAA